MYALLLALHSLVRWLVLLSLLLAIVRAYHGWFTGRKFSKTDHRVRVAAVTIAHTQVFIGIWLYIISPLVAVFMQHFKQMVHDRHIRFFGMEHITMMLIAIILLTIGSAKTKRKSTDTQQFKCMAIWFTIALLIIFLSIPWSFSPFTSRPLFRSF
jgi:hypothetical protein